jgi:hypothetical protein
VSLAGSVLSAGQPVGGAAVTFYAAGTCAPTQLAKGRADNSGAFTLTYGDALAKSILYDVAEGGTPEAVTGKGANDGHAVLAMLGASVPIAVTVNELPTNGLSINRRAVQYSEPSSPRDGWWGTDDNSTPRDGTQVENRTGEA